MPYGVLILTTVYVGLVVVLVYALPVECLGGTDCNSEGLDNSILGWVTDFWIAIHMILLAIQLQWFVHRPVYRSVVVALASMGVAYILGGLGHSVFTNSGFDDNAGQQGFYITWAFSFTFMTLSVQQVYQFTRQLIERYYAVAFANNANCWLRVFLHTAFVMVMLSWMATIGGYFWCATESDIHVSNNLDDVAPIDKEEEESLNTCLQLASAAEISWYCTYSLFWIPVGILLRRIILEQGESTESDQPRLVYGMSNARAAILLTIIPWTFGIMLIVYSGLAALALNVEVTQVYETIYGAVIYHYGMLLSYFLLHNIAYSLPCDEAVVPADSSSNKANGGGASLHQHDDRPRQDSRRIPDSMPLEDFDLESFQCDTAMEAEYAW